ncbi:MAG: HpaII family restriction endonuclease [Vampirovibrionales bacterium]
MMQLSLLTTTSSAELPFENEGKPYRFIDLFAGIGGFHLALASLGAECVFMSEKDAEARKTYLHNHALPEACINTDIRNIAPEAVPDHDVLCAGFPCQPFSQAGRKKGFTDGDDSERGNLFFCILDILEAKRPSAFILENVRHLEKHDEGKTLRVIRESIEHLGYTFTYAILKASDFGVPQHRPRIFMVGFDKKQVNTSTTFTFPTPIPLQFTMSDVWGGECSRTIGFTLRVGGKGSDITDRRNWDSYLVNGEVRRLGVEQAKKMMGLPESFTFPVSRTQAMKQLGNSVCVPVVQQVARQVSRYLTNYQYDTACPEGAFMNGTTFNKGEWSELVIFISLLLHPQCHYGTPQLEALHEFVTFLTLSHNTQPHYYQLGEQQVLLMTATGEVLKTIPREDLTNIATVEALEAQLRAGQRAFSMPALDRFKALLEIERFKGSNKSKHDFSASFNDAGTVFEGQGLGMKSYIGQAPTLLNASSATNFVFRLNAFDGSLDAINALEGKQKIRDRLMQIYQTCTSVEFVRCENSTHEANLRKVDSLLPEILAKLLLQYYQGQGAMLQDLITNEQEQCRIQDYLKSILLGMFSTTPWDGTYSSHGFVVLTKTGNRLLYHVVKDAVLKEFLWKHVKLDTPSSSRHRFGTVYKEADGQFYFKLNLQLRFC